MSALPKAFAFPVFPPAALALNLTCFSYVRKYLRAGVKFLQSESHCSMGSVDSLHPNYSRLAPVRKNTKWNWKELPLGTLMHRSEFTFYPLGLRRRAHGCIWGT